MAVLTVMLGTPTFTLRTISNPMLQELLTQLARFYRANEASISAEEVSRCQECLPASEISALDRLFSLFLHHAQQVSLQFPRSSGPCANFVSER